MENKSLRKIVFEDGTELYGKGFGTSCDKVCELVFNTSVVGYQEILSDPTYTDQIVVMTYPLIGNYGIADDDFETKNPTIGGLIVREYNDSPSNFRYTKTLSEIMEENKIPGIEGIDTRMLTRKIRTEGSCKVLLTSADTPLEEALEDLREHELATDLVKKVSCKKKWYSRTNNPKLNVVAVDLGVKLSLIRALNKLGCNVTVVPFDTDAEAIKAMNPDGIFISSGPGSPCDIPEVLALVKNLIGFAPVMGIGLGHQLVCMAQGASVTKMSHGHRGGYAVKNLLTGKTELTSQNHSYVVDLASLEGTGLEVTHVNVADGSCEGTRNLTKKLFSVQYYPESAPGPQDSMYVLEDFIAYMREENENA